MPVPQALIAADFKFACEQDAETVATLYEATFAKEWKIPSCRATLSGPGVVALLSFDSEEPTGFFIARVAADEAEIITFGVVPASRCRGYGRLLLTKGLRRCAALGARKIFLEVAMDNLAARALYTSKGFAEAGYRPGYYSRGQGEHTDALVLARSLKPCTLEE